VRVPIILALSSSALCIGCYARHGAEDAPRPRDSGAPRADARSIPGPPDAGTHDAGAVDFDAGAVDYDAGRVLPEEPEPPVEPGERPSERPPADEWTDPPDADPDVCCDLDDPLEITPPGAQGSVPVVAWTGSGWSVLFQSHDPDGALPVASEFVLYHALLDPDVTRVESFQPVPGRGASLVRAGEWAAGRHAVLATQWRNDTASFGLLDGAGTLTAWWADVPAEGRDGAVARQVLGATWAVVTRRDDRIEVRGFDSSTTETALHTIDDVAEGGPVGAEGLDSRVAVAWIADGQLRLQSVVVGEGLVDAPMELGPVSLGTDSSLATAAFRDQVAITHLDGRRAWLTLADPFERTHQRVDLGEARVGDREVGVVGVTKFGMLGTCIPVGPGPWGGSTMASDEGVAFQLVSADGTLLGERVTIVDDLRNVGGCAVAFHRDSFIVLWWRASGDRVYNSLWARRVRPRLPF